MEALNRIKADVLAAVGEFRAEILALDGVTGDALAAPAGKLRDKLAFEIHALDRVAIIAGLEALRHTLGAMCRFRVIGRIGQNALAVKPPALDPGPPERAIDRSRRCRD